MSAQIGRIAIAVSLLCSLGCTGSISGRASGGPPSDGGSVSGAGGAPSRAGAGNSGSGNMATGGALGGRPDAIGAPPQGSGGSPADAGNKGNDAAPSVGPISTTMALNVRLQTVEITQAVSISMGPDASGGAIAVAARNGKALEKRNALIRAHYAVGPGWMPRNIEAVLYLNAVNSAATPMALTKMITASSVPATLDSTFNWTLSDVQTVAGLTAHVELHEVPGASPNGATLDSPRFPNQGEADLGIQAGEMQVNIVLVPVTVGGTTVAINPSDIQSWGDYLQGVYPIQKSFFTVHPVADPSWTTFGSGQETPAFDLCAQIKAMDKGAPNLYHVLVVPGSKANVGWDGSSSVAGDKQSDAVDRCSIVITDKTNTLPPKNLTFAHEVGHAHGLEHAPCGGAASPDPKYPYPKALIGAQGYNFVKKVLYDPAKITDLMSYCEPAWISDYYWNKLETRVRIQTTWGIHHQADDQGAGGVRVESRSVRGLFRSTDQIGWAIILGEVSEPTAVPDSFVRVVDGKWAGTQLPFLLRKMTASHGLYEFKFSLPADNDATAFDVSVSGIDRRLTLAEIPDLSR